MKHRIIGSLVVWSFHVMVGIGLAFDAWLMLRGAK